MKSGLAVSALILLGTLPVTPAPSLGATDAAERTVRDGVFSLEQAKRGEKAFTSACAGCHGSDLTGDGLAPSLAGPRFLRGWSGSTVKDLFELIRTSMPPDGPKAVLPGTKADIVAHLLAFNNYPTGDGVIEADALKLARIRIVPPAPGPTGLSGLAEADPHPAACPPPGRGPRPRDPLVRLSKAELSNTLEDLIGKEAVDRLPALAGLISTIPDDDRQGGFANLQWSLSADHVGGYLGLANEIGTQMSASRELRLKLLPCADDPEHLSEGCLESFLDDFASRAYRRPLEPAERAGLMAFFHERRTQSPALALGALITRVLMAPAFLFKQGAGPVRASDDCRSDQMDESFARASRMSYSLWGTMPDPALFAAARALDLLDGAKLANHAERMAGEPRTRRWIRTFFRQWLHYDQHPTEAYSAGFLGPVERAHLHDEATAELDRFIETIVWTDRGAFRDLLVSRKVLTDAPSIRTIYRLPPRTAPGVELAPRNRAGLLTRVALLAQGSDEASLVKRGAFVRRQLLCDPLSPPDPSLVPPGSLVPPEKDHRLTTRQRWEARTAPTICQGCHRLINPLGIALEAYDGIGRFRRIEKLPVPNSTPARFVRHVLDTVVTPFIERRAEPPIDGPVALSLSLADSEKAKVCFVEQLTKFVSGRAAAQSPALPPRADNLTDKMMRDSSSVRDTLLSIVKLHAAKEIGPSLP